MQGENVRGAIVRLPVFITAHRGCMPWTCECEIVHTYLPRLSIAAADKVVFSGVLQNFFDTAEYYACGPGGCIFTAC